MGETGIAAGEGPDGAMGCKSACCAGAARNTNKLAGGAFGGNATAATVVGAGDASSAAGAGTGKASREAGATVTGAGVSTPSCGGTSSGMDA